MTVTVSNPAMNLREQLAQAKARVGYAQTQQWFTGDGSTTSFTLDKGWSPMHVFVAGSLNKEGSGDNYTVSFNGFAYSVVFNSAPASAAKIGVIRERQE